MTSIHPDEPSACATGAAGVIQVAQRWTILRMLGDTIITSLIRRYWPRR